MYWYMIIGLIFVLYIWICLLGQNYLKLKTWLKDQEFGYKTIFYKICPLIQFLNQNFNDTFSKTFFTLFVSILITFFWPLSFYFILSFYLYKLRDKIRIKHKESNPKLYI
jgi:hypothetical protein